MTLPGYITSIGGNENCLQNFDWKSEGKRPLNRSIWEVNIKEDLKELGRGLNPCGSELDAVTES
jgi:hypothetical protein